jgi:hypothetical protein
LGDFITSLEIDRFIGDGPVKKAALDVITQMPNLRRLFTSPDLALTTLPHALTSESLQTLEGLCLKDEDVDPLLESGARFRTQLSTLRMATTHTSVFVKFLTAARPCRLRQLSLDLCSAITPVLPPIFSLLSTYCSSTLQSLHVDFGFYQAGSALTRDAFQLLLDLRCLKELVVLGVILSLGDRGFEEIVLAWPQLELLQITTSIAIDESAISMFISRGLASLLSNCEKLKNLRLAIEWDNIYLRISDKCGVCNQKVINSNIYHTRLRDVTGTLAEILPDLCFVECFSRRQYHARSGIPHEASESTAHRSPQNITEPESD